ncbi:MAG TPA: 50S ribosomal protein L25 [Bacteroidia bacterium]|jgi:large subunit ribosomal protein L25|nr:50S ribosomal protein L25 [Bacteroidia bacterium]
MKTLTINGTVRKDKGSKDAKTLRQSGSIPCVLYGGKEQVLFSVTENQFVKLLYTPDAYLVNLELDGKTVKAIVQDSQFDKISDKVTHVDFMEAVPGKALNVKIPVITHGSPPGVKKGGKLAVKIRRLSVKGLVDDIPDQINLDVASLDLGQSIKVRDMKFEKIQFLDPANAAIVAVKMTREAELPAATPGAAAPGAAAAAPAAGAPAAAAPAAAKKDEKPAAKK